MQRSGGSSESLDLDLVKQSLALRVHSVDDADDIRRPPETPVETAVMVGFVHLMGWGGDGGVCAPDGMDGAGTDRETQHEEGKGVNERRVEGYRI
jgi:hypothetical protein